MNDIKEDWFVAVPSVLCPYSGYRTANNFLFGIKFFKEKCNHPKHPNANIWTYPKCNKDICPIKIKDDKI